MDKFKILGLLPPDHRGNRKSYHIQTVDESELEASIKRIRLDHPEAYAVREHTMTRHCWCHPTLEYVDPETGTECWVHHKLS